MTKIQQRIHVNRVKANSIEFDLDEMTIPINIGDEASIELIIINYGNPGHVHLSVNDDVRNQVSFFKDNPYVKYEERIPMIIRLPKEGGHQEGEIFITTGYGSNKKSFKFRIPMKEMKHEVVVGERLTKEVPKKEKREPRNIDLIAFFGRTQLMMPTVTILFILLLLFLTFGVYSSSDPFMGSLSASILIVFLILYGLKRSFDLSV
ncbi:MAG: hypothetical protein SVY15_06695 [Halobacteriota archaeon]|nr:hypothetical protein [Halobacteriota archaeon]